MDGELHTTTYDQDSGWVIDGSGGLLGVYSDVSGAGLSQNLVNNGTNIVNSATIYFTGPSFPITLYGAYEHATETVTLAQSQNYKINKNGKGSVFDFASSVVDKYDNTQGVEITVSLPF